MAKKGFGTTLSGSIAGAIGKIIDFSEAMMEEAEIIDATNMASPGQYKEKDVGLLDAGRISFTLEYDGGASGITDVINTNKFVKQTWTVTFPDGATRSCDGFIYTLSTPAPLREKIVQTVGIEFSGQPTFTKAA